MITFKEDQNHPGEFKVIRNRKETDLFVEADSAAEAEEKFLELATEGRANGLLRVSIADRDARIKELEEELAKIMAIKAPKPRRLFGRKAV